MSDTPKDFLARCALVIGFLLIDLIGLLFAVVSVAMPLIILIVVAAALKWSWHILF